MQCDQILTFTTLPRQTSDRHWRCAALSVRLARHSLLRCPSRLWLLFTCLRDPRDVLSIIVWCSWFVLFLQTSVSSAACTFRRTDDSVHAALRTSIASVASQEHMSSCTASPRHTKMEADSVCGLVIVGVYLQVVQRVAKVKSQGHPEHKSSGTQATPLHWTNVFCTATYACGACANVWFGIHLKMLNDGGVCNRGTHEVKTSATSGHQCAHHISHPHKIRNGHDYCRDEHRGSHPDCSQNKIYTRGGTITEIDDNLYESNELKTNLKMKVDIEKETYGSDEDDYQAGDATMDAQ